jgi:type II secretory pathway component PulM
MRPLWGQRSGESRERGGPNEHRLAKVRVLPLWGQRSGESRKSGGPMSAPERNRWLPASLAAAWDRASPRERRMAIAGAAIVALGVGWGLLWQPMRADIDRIRLELSRATEVLAATRNLADEAAGLARETPPIRGADLRTVVARVLAERGLRAAGTLDVKDNRVTVVVSEARFDALVGALEALRSSDGLRAVEATLTPRVEPGTVRAELVLAR